MPCAPTQHNESSDPRHKGECCICGHPITGPGISTDENFEEFFDRLENGMFKLWTAPALEADPGGKEKERAFFWSLRALCKHREREGRDKFGLSYLRYPALQNTAEEAADICVYSYLEQLKTLQEGGEDDGIDKLLNGCKKVIEGLEEISGYAGTRRGNP